MLAVGGAAWAGDCHAEAPKAAATAPQMAQFWIPELTADLAKEVVKALAGQPGIMAAKPSVEDSLLSVTFDPKKTTAEKVTETVAAAAPGATLEEVGDAPPAAQGPCGGCPSRKTCANSKE